MGTVAVPSPPGRAAAPVSTVLPYYYSTMLVIYEHLNILAMFCYNLHPTQPEEDWPPHIAWFLSRVLCGLYSAVSHRSKLVVC